MQTVGDEKPHYVQLFGRVEESPQGPILTDAAGHSIEMEQLQGREVYVLRRQRGDVTRGRPLINSKVVTGPFRINAFIPEFGRVNVKLIEGHEYCGDTKLGEYHKDTERNMFHPNCIYIKGNGQSFGAKEFTFESAFEDLQAVGSSGLGMYALTSKVSPTYAYIPSIGAAALTAGSRIRNYYDGSDTSQHIKRRVLQKQTSERELKNEAIELLKSHHKEARRKWAVKQTKACIDEEIDNRIEGNMKKVNVDQYAQCLCEVYKEKVTDECKKEYTEKIITYMQKRMVDRQKNVTAYMISKVNTCEEHLRKAAMKLAKYRVGVRHIKEGDLSIIDEYTAIETDYEDATGKKPVGVKESSDLDWKMSNAAAQGYINGQLSHAACVVVENALLNEKRFEKKKNKTEGRKNAESLVEIVDNVFLVRCKQGDESYMQYRCEVKNKVYNCVPIVNHDPCLHKSLKDKGYKFVDSFYYIVLIDRNTEGELFRKHKCIDDANYVPLIFHKSSAVPVSNYEREKEWKTIRDLHFGLCKNSGDRTPDALDKAIRLLLGRKI